MTKPSTEEVHITEGTELVSAAMEMLGDARADDSEKTRVIDEVVVQMEKAASVSIEHRAISSEVEGKVQELQPDILGVRHTSRNVEAITGFLEQLVGQFKLTETRKVNPDEKASAPDTARMPFGMSRRDLNCHRILYIVEIIMEQIPIVRTGDGSMPEFTSVSVVFRMIRDEGEQVLAASGKLHKLAAGWAVTCRFLSEPGGGAEESGLSEIMLIVRDGEIRMNRKGAVSQEQLFRMGERVPGTIRTVYGTMNAEARTYRMRAGLSKAGGTVEWEYEMKAADLDLGRCSILMDVREEPLT